EYGTPSPTLKKCYKCKMELDVALFSRDGSRPDGLQAACKTCKAEMKRQWVEANKIRVAEYQQQYGKKYREENRDAILAYDRRRYAENKDARLNMQRRYIKANRDEILERRRIRRVARRDEVNERQRRYYEKNKWS